MRKYKKKVKIEIGKFMTVETNDILFHLNDHQHTIIQVLHS